MPFVLVTTVAVAGKAVGLGPGSDRPFGRVVAVGVEGQDRVRVIASTDAGDSCESLTTTPSRSPKGAVVVDIVLTASPQGDGVAWKVSDVDAGAFSPSFRARPTSKVLEVDPTGTTRFELDAVLEDTRGREPAYHISGTLEAEPCGRQPAERSPEVRLQPGTLVFAGRTVELLGARLQTRGEHQVLSVSSHPMSCREVADANVVFQMQLDGRWNQANGNWTGGMHHSASFSFRDAEGRSLTAAEAVDGVVRVEGTWAGKTFAAPAVATGPFDALDCR